ncbi:uncharacterized protein LOC144104733 [Amblyomma americanum]
MPLNKFRSRHKFGKKKKSARGDNFRKRPASPECSENVQEPVASEVPADEIGLTSSATSTHSGRVRCDTTMLQPSDLLENKRKAEGILQELESTAATKKKLDFIGSCDDCPLDGTDGRRADDSAFSIVSLDSFNELLRAVKCRVCGGDVHVSKGNREYGLAVKLSLVCVNCGDTASAWSSPRAEGSQKINPFAVNILAARAMQSTGNRRTALNDVFAAMNISHRGLHTKTWQSYVKSKLTPAATRAAEKVLNDSANSVRQLYRELNLDNPGNISVSFDGSWMTRGHSSRIGVGAVIELFTGLVLDYVVFSNFCAGCERGPKDDDPSYQAWSDSHLCQKNTDKKSGEMEVQAGLVLFERSWEKHGLRYTTVLSDGDSRTFLALQESSVYGYIKIQKEDCTNHVQKRMGTALRNAIAKHKGNAKESLSGKGKLTGDLVTKLTSYYSWALKSHAGDIGAMHKAVMATYYHVTSNDSAANHTLCPTGPNSWCRQNAAAAKGELAPKHRYNLPPHVCKALFPIYERLGDPKLLQRCLRGKTQNNNESLHSLIWSLAPKERHASLFSVQAAVAEAVVRFNAGNLKASFQILSELSMNPGQHNIRRMTEKDRRRTAESARKRASTETMHQALKKRHSSQTKQSDYMPGAY